MSARKVSLMPLVREPGAPAPYQQIRHILREEILSGLHPGDRIAPERDLAKRFGANRATISRAIASLVNDGLLVRRVGRGTFVANGDEGSRRTRTQTVGLVVPFIQGDFPAGIIRSAVKSLRDLGYKAVLFDSEGDLGIESSEIDRLTQEGLDGALIMPVDKTDNSEMFGRLVRLGYPLVFVDRRPARVDGDLVASDNFKASYELVTRLIERGHRRIAHFTWLVGWDSTTIRDRRLGYEQALMDNGIEVDPELICPPAPFPDDASAFKHILSYIRQGSTPVTALFILNDTFVTAAVAGCRALGLRIPDDIEVAAFYDGNVLPPVPIIRAIQNQPELGRQAVDLLMKRIEGNGPAGPQTILIQPDMVEEQSFAMV